MEWNDDDDCGPFYTGAVTALAILALVAILTFFVVTP